MVCTTLPLIAKATILACMWHSSLILLTCLHAGVRSSLDTFSELMNDQSTSHLLLSPLPPEPTSLSPAHSSSESPSISPPESTCLSPAHSPPESPSLSPAHSSSESPSLSPAHSSSKSPSLSPAHSPPESLFLSPAHSSSESPSLSPAHLPPESISPPPEIQSSTESSFRQPCPDPLSDSQLFAPLYPGAHITLCGALCAIMHFCTTNKLSYTAIGDLLKLLSILCPFPNLLPGSFYKFKKFFQQFQSIHNQSEICLKCQQSTKVTCSCENVSRETKAHLIHLEIQKPLERILIGR